MAIGYHRPNGQESVSYQTYDVGYRIINNSDPYTPAPTDVMAVIDRDNWYLLRHDNAFGNKQHFTGQTGGYWDSVTEEYKDVLGVVTTEALAFPNDYVIDHFTGLGWYKYRLSNQSIPAGYTWLHVAVNGGAGWKGYFDWWLGSRAEQESIMEFNYLDTDPAPVREPFDMQLTGKTSSPYYDNPTTQGYEISATGKFNGSKAYSAAASFRLMRFHYT